MNNQVVQREQNLKTLFANKTKMIQSILGDKKKADRFTATALQVALNKDLSSCTEESIVNCAIGVAMLDLSLDKNIGQAYLIKYGQECTLQVGYKGWLALLYRAGYEVRTFPVFKTDEFSVNFDGWDMNYKLNPNLEDRDIGNFDWEFENLDGVIVAAKDLSTGEIKRDFVSKATIEKMRLSSPNQKPSQYDKPNQESTKRKQDKLPVGIWWDWYIDMCQKSAIKKVKNQIALREEITNIAIADTLENNKTIDFEKTRAKGVVIEAKEIESRPQVKSLNDIQAQEIDYSQEVFNKMIANKVSKEDAQEYINSKSDEELKQLLKDDDLFQNECMEFLI